MEVAILLLNQIVQLFLMILMGILLVKSGVLRAGQSKSLSVVVLYIVMPCVIIHAFQVDYTKEIRNGLLLALLAAVIIHLIMLLVTEVLSRLCHMDAVEKVSVIYSNSGNLIIPIVTGVLGEELNTDKCKYDRHPAGDRSVPAPDKTSVYTGRNDRICEQYGRPHIHDHHRYADRRYESEKNRRLPSGMADDLFPDDIDPGHHLDRVESERFVRSPSRWGYDLADQLPGIDHPVGLHHDPDGADLWKRCGLCQCDQCGDNGCLYHHHAADGFDLLEKM